MEKTEQHQFNFGDIVTIRETPLTIENSISGLRGEVYGFTTPSMMPEIEVIGDKSIDFALSINIEKFDEVYWLTPDLVEFVDSNVGSTMTLGDKEFIKDNEGEWRERTILPDKLEQVITDYKIKTDNELSSNSQSKEKSIWDKLKFWK